MVRNLRLASVSLLLLGWFAWRLAEDRDRLVQALREIEQKVVIISIARASTARVPPDADPPYVPEAESTRYAVAETAYRAFASRGEIYALGQMWERFPAAYQRFIQLPGGGRIYFATPHDAEAATDYVDVFGEAGDLAWCEPRRPRDAKGQDDLLFFLPIVVAPYGDQPSDLVSGSYRFVVTNFDVDGDATSAETVCARAGPDILIVNEHDGDFSETDLVTTQELESDVLLIGRQIGIISDDASQTYVAARSKLEAGRVTLPVLGGDVPATTAILVTGAAVLFLLAWSSFLLRSIAAVPFTADEPFGFRELRTMWRTANLTQRLAISIEGSVGVTFHVAAVLLPLVVFTIILTKEGALTAFGCGGLAVGAILASSCILSLIDAARRSLSRAAASLTYDTAL